MRIHAAKGHIEFDWEDKSDLTIKPDSYRFTDVEPAVEAFIRNVLANNHSIAISGGNMPDDLRPFYEGLYQVLMAANAAYATGFAPPSLSRTKKMPPGVIY